MDDIWPFSLMEARIKLRYSADSIMLGPHTFFFQARKSRARSDTDSWFTQAADPAPVPSNQESN